MSAGAPAGPGRPGPLGVTVGKFLPFHRGHDLLLREARDRLGPAGTLACVLGSRPDDAVPGPARAAWLREEHPDLVVLETPDDLPAAPEPWAWRTLALLAAAGLGAPDVAFTSEAYGDPWAAAMGCRHEAIDPGRARVPASGTTLRADLAAGWTWLTPPARAWFTRRVVVLGVESSGTTTLARDLARAFGTAWVPEWGRDYWEGRRWAPEADRWTPGDFLRIARGQAAREDDLARRAGPALVCDTDPLATCVWARRYLGACPPALAAFAATRRPALYLLTAPDFPFVQDGTRESEALRPAMHGWFVDALEASGVPWRLLGGPGEARLAAAREVVAPLLRFAPLPDPT